MFLVFSYLFWKESVSFIRYASVGVCYLFSSDLATDVHLYFI